MWKIILAFIFCSSSWAYNLTKDFTDGFYWASLPINITVVESDVNRKSTMENLAKQAINEWQTKTGLSLWKFISSTSSQATPNVIRWSTNFAAETKMDPSSVLAVAIRYTNGPYFSQTEIVINGNHFLNMNTSNLLTTITHELGHTMGLDHSNNPYAVMAPTLQDPYTGLNNDDLQGMASAVSETEHREQTNYISPLAYQKENKTTQALSCGTVGIVGSGGASQSILSLTVGLLIGLVGRILKWFKSRI
ncbi:MAG: matrixin family metalloprotease [Bacteriovoracaceae bacterium]